MNSATPLWAPILWSLRRSEYKLRVSSLFSIWLERQVTVSFRKASLPYSSRGYYTKNGWKYYCFIHLVVVYV